MVGDPQAELEAVDAMVADWEHSGQERLARVQEVTSRMAELSATETSADGVVSVTVGSNGLPTDIVLTEDAKQQPMSAVSATIMATLRQAQARIPALMTQAAADLGLAGDSVVAHLLQTAEQSFPSPAPETPARRPAEDDEDFSDNDPLRDRW